MILPSYLLEKINSLYSSLNKSKLTQIQRQLTEKYKTKSGRSESLISTKEDSMIYAISRMPATYSVVYSLINDLSNQGLLKDFSSVLDLGSGTGTVYFALKELKENLDITLVERDKNMIEIFKSLTENTIDVVKNDILKFETSNEFDFVVSSYVLSEMTETDRFLAVEKMLKKTSKYLLLVDTGTPEVYHEYMKIKEFVSKKGYKIIAPCMSEKCGLEGDYCQFYARVERSSLHKLAKNGTLSYEDEKYFYLLISKDESLVQSRRIIRRPVIKENNVELVLCSNNGVFKENFTKKNKEEFKKARKIKINHLI